MSIIYHSTINFYSILTMKKLLFILILFCSIQAFGQNKGYWRLIGNSNDISGNGNNGTDANITYSNGAVFNGTSSKITIANSILPSSATSFTFSAFINIPNISNTKTIICDRAGSTYGYKYMIKASGSINTIFIYNSGGVTQESNYVGTNRLSANKWIHVVAMLDLSNTQIRDYINGQQVGYGAYIANSYPSQTTASSIGVTTGPATQEWFTGKMCELKMDNTVWYPAKIKNEYSRITGFFQN